ncbi:MAG: hypothetical protein IPF53_09790 [Blastocatellia bacterium]|jgi:hypothetical protein|nr:hypothetical protein [Blastocatellia bacterium]MBK6424909.1 hypothetical protein [Blastocatellia bacterium]
MTEVSRSAGIRAAVAALAVVLAAPVAFAQEPQPGQGGDRSDSVTADAEAVALPLQQYTDPAGRFGFVVPSQWGRSASETVDEIIFQNERGDSVRVTIAPLTVDPKAFANAYVDTYLKVLSQSLTDIRFVGQRPIDVGRRKATDYVFTGTFNEAPVTCRQVVVIGSTTVLYITFAGFGQLRTQSEQLFQSSLLTFWISPSFGGPVSIGTADPNAPAYTIAIPEGWTDEGETDGNSHMFRPAGARPSSAYISTRVTKIAPDSKLTEIDDVFIAAYRTALRQQYPENAMEVRLTRKIFIGGAPAVRFDYGYISNFGVRRAIMVLAVRNGYLIGLACDSVEQAYPIYEKSFETLFTTFKFR